LDSGPSLRGDGALTYARALAAVGNEELLLQQQEEERAAPPRLWALRALAAAAAAAASGGGGPRAHASRVWSVAGAHLAAAACGESAVPAATAVDLLAGLADVALAKGSGGAGGSSGAGGLGGDRLRGFRGRTNNDDAANAAAPSVPVIRQREALSPLEAVARGGGSASVREAAVSAVGAVIQPHARRLSAAGWRAAARVLAAGAADAASPAVVGAALDAAAPAAEALFRHRGCRRAATRGVVAALATAMRNPAHEQLSISAGFALQVVARRLAEAGVGSSRGENGGGDDGDDDDEEYLAAVAAAREAAASSDTSSSSACLPLYLPSAWDDALSAFAAVARHDPRPAVADAAAAALFEVCSEVAGSWSSSSSSSSGWRAFGGHAIRYVLDLPASPADDVRNRSRSRSPSPPASSLAPRPVGWSVEGEARLLRHAGAHLPPAAAAVAASLPSSLPALRPLLSLCVRYCLAPDARAAALGAVALEAALVPAAVAAAAAGGEGGPSPPSWWEGEIVPALRDASRGDVLAKLTRDRSSSDPEGSPPPVPLPGARTPLGALPPSAEAAAAADGSGLARVRARSVLLVQRCLASSAARAAASGAPRACVSSMLLALSDSAKRAAECNRDSRARAAAAALLLGSSSAPSPPAAPAADEEDEGEEEEEGSFPAGFAAAADPRWAAAPEPALARQEAEGGALLLAALRARVEAAAAGEESGGGGEGEDGDDDGVALLAAARDALLLLSSPSSSSDGGAAPSSGSSPALSWLAGVREPWVVAALEAAAAAPASAWRRKGTGASALAALAPWAADGRPGVRRALASALEARVAGMLKG